LSTAYAPPARLGRVEVAIRNPRRWLPLALSVLVTLLAAPIGLLATERFQQLADSTLLGYPCLFLVQMLSSATLFLPAPGAAVVMAAGTFWNPLWVGIIAGLGSATGELTGYGLGYYGRRAVPVDTSRCWRLAERGFRRFGFLALIVLAVIPNPFFDALGILAGCLRYPLLRYWAATAIGKILKFGALAYLAEAAMLWMRAAA
jgi:membrane protein YqaA with SNARE-associated domain